MKPREGGRETKKTVYRVFLNEMNLTYSYPTRPAKNDTKEFRKATNAMKATTMAVMLITRMAASLAPLVAASRRLGLESGIQKEGKMCCLK